MFGAGLDIVAVLIIKAHCHKAGLAVKEWGNVATDGMAQSNPLNLPYNLVRCCIQGDSASPLPLLHRSQVTLGNDVILLPHPPRTRPRISQMRAVSGLVGATVISYLSPAAGRSFTGSAILTPATQTISPAASTRGMCGRSQRGILASTRKS
jgi:hypothetical protein